MDGNRRPRPASPPPYPAAVDVRPRHLGARGDPDPVTVIVAMISITRGRTERVRTAAESPADRQGEPLAPRDRAA